MAVRTRQAGIKNKREVDPRSAVPSTGATGGRKKTLPRDEALALRRTQSASKMKLGPAAKENDYARALPVATVNGRKKPPSEMHVRHKGGPRKRSRLHGG